LSVLVLYPATRSIDVEPAILDDRLQYGQRSVFLYALTTTDSAKGKRMSVTADIALIDHHCHGLLPETPSNDDFRLLATEADFLSDPGLETLYSPFGLAIRKICAPVLDLERHTSIDAYLDRRRELGANEVNTRMMKVSGLGQLLIDSGFVASPVLSPSAMEAALGIPTEEIVRLERVAEQIAPATTAGAFVGDFRVALDLASETAVGFKSIIAYRFGFDISPTPPTLTEVSDGVGEWLRRAQKRGSYRLDHPVVLQHLLWEAVSYGKPIQMHTGYGDSDIELFRADPSRATRFFEATRVSGAKFTLLHCYPFIRESAILSQVFPHVYCDVGAVTHYLGPSAGTAIRQVMEIAPFNKVLFSSDAHGLAEHYLVSSVAWRHHMDVLLNEWVAADWTTQDEAQRIAQMIGVDNARRIYSLDAVS